MKKIPHPIYHTIMMIQTDGATYNTHTCLRKSIFQIDMDTKTHSTWNRTKIRTNIDASHQRSRFIKRYKQFV